MWFIELKSELFEIQTVLVFMILPFPSDRKVYRVPALITLQLPADVIFFFKVCLGLSPLNKYFCDVF